MGYTLQEQYNSKNQVPGADANSVWGLGPRKVTSGTIHHWGDPGQQFDIVRDFLCTNNTPTSAHYVVQDGLVACIVSPDDCAFHAGNAEGNTFSIGIELRPEATDGDYQTAGELVAFLRGIYGDFPLFPHNHWFATACPGDYDLTRIDAIARGTTPPTEDFLATLTDQDKNNLFNALARIDAKANALPDKQYWADMVNAMARVDHAVPLLPSAVLNAQFKLPDGTQVNLAGILGAINAKPVTAGTVANVTTDPQAIAAAVAAEIKAQWNK